MTTFDRISDQYLDQLFPEKSLSNQQKKEFFLFALGLTVEDIAILSNCNRDSVRKRLSKTATLFTGSSHLQPLRAITSARIFFTLTSSLKTLGFTHNEMGGKDE